jgi:hypothetical protein
MSCQRGLTYAELTAGTTGTDGFTSSYTATAATGVTTAQYTTCSGGSAANCYENGFCDTLTTSSCNANFAASSTCEDTSTPSPTNEGDTPSPTVATVDQDVIFDLDASAWTGDLQTFWQKAYGQALGIYTSPETGGPGVEGTWSSGYSVSSTAARRSTTVTFATTVPSGSESAIETSANALTASALTTAATNVASVELNYGSYDTSTVTSVDYVTGSDAAAIADALEAYIYVIIVVAVLCPLITIGIMCACGVTCCLCCCKQSKEGDKAAEEAPHVQLDGQTPDKAEGWHVAEPGAV